MEPGNLKFSFNWNKKLDCESAFSTIRLESPKYYLGAKFHWWLEEKGAVAKEGFATIYTINCITIDQITEPMARLDTGLSRQACITMLKNEYNKVVTDWSTQKIVFIVLVKD